MTWTKTGDDYPERLFELSDAAYRLHHAGTTYANRLLLDGRIPKSRLDLVPVPRNVLHESVLEELSSAGLWLDAGDGWVLTDFLSAQPTREEVEARRGYDAVRQRLRFARSAMNRDQGEAALVLDLEELEREARFRLNAAREAHRSLSSLGASQRESHTPRPVPTRPDPTRPVPSGTRDGSKRKARRARTSRLAQRSRNWIPPESQNLIKVDKATIAGVRQNMANGASLKQIVEGTGLFSQPTRLALGLDEPK